MIPNVYRLVQYIETQSTDQYIKTDIEYTQDYSLKAKVLIPQGVNWGLGARQAYNSNQIGILGADTVESIMYVRYYNVEWNINNLTSIERNNPIEISVSKNVSKVITISAARTHTFSYGSFTSPKVYIFALNQNGTVTKTSKAGCRLYYLSISDGNGVAVATFVPCIRRSDGAVGLLDTSHDVFYTNDGTGEFTAGPDVIDSISPWMIARRSALISGLKPTLPVFSYRDLQAPSSNIDTGVLALQEGKRGWTLIVKLNISSASGIITNLLQWYYTYWYWGGNTNVSGVTRIVDNVSLGNGNSGQLKTFALWVDLKTMKIRTILTYDAGNGVVERTHSDNINNVYYSSETIKLVKNGWTGTLDLLQFYDYPLKESEIRRILFN